MGSPNNDNAKVLLAALEKMGEIDPMAIVIMTAAAGAGLAGQVGPLTRIVNAFIDPNSQNAITNFVPGGSMNPIGLGPGLISFLMPGSGQTVTDDPDAMKRFGYAAENIVESGILYTFVKNPESMKMVGDILKKAVDKIPTP